MSQQSRRSDWEKVEAIEKEEWRGRAFSLLVVEEKEEEGSSSNRKRRETASRPKLPLFWSFSSRQSANCSRESEKSIKKFREGLQLSSYLPVPSSQTKR